MKKKVIIIKHQTFREITNEEVLKTLKIDEIDTNIYFVDVKYKLIPMDEIDGLDNGEAKSYQKQMYETIIKPLIEQNSGARICYFGATTIPLAVHLGYCFGGWHKIEIFVLNRETNSWEWIQPEDESLETNHKFPSDVIEVNTEVLYKVEASYPMQQEEIKESIGANFQTVALSLLVFDKDAFKSPKQLEKFGYAFSQGLDAIATHIPNADKIHLLVTAPVGVAFYLGTRFNPNITKPVVLYQYNTNKDIKYEEIFVLQEDGSRISQIGEEDEKYIMQIRSRLKKELEEKVSPYANNKKEDVEKAEAETISWVDLILPKGDYESLRSSYWKYLANVAETILTNTTLLADTKEADERDGFYIEDNGDWQISDRSIFNIVQRIGKDEGKVIRALRMFMFHEAFHIHQNLTNRTARAIGRFPRILEEADYAADVWTFLHEYSFSKMYYSKETEDHKSFFKGLFQLAMETMWSFVELAPNNNEIQIRAVNRFLTWYWVYNLVDDRKCQSIQNIVIRLAIKPIIEIKGLDIKAQAQRTIYKLNNPRLDELEIGYCSPDMKIYRVSNAAGLNIGNLVSGFKERNSRAVHDEMKTFYHIIGPHLTSF